MENQEQFNQIIFGLEVTFLISLLGYIAIKFYFKKQKEKNIKNIENNEL
jgi:hypothetical protein